MQKQVKKSKLTSMEMDKLKQYIVDLDRDVANLFQYLLVLPRVYIQNTVPTIPNDTIALWKDTLNTKYYWIINIDATQKKVELT